MKRIVFLVEDYSMKILLDGMLPRLFPELHFLCVHHEGKQDLDKSVPRKLKQWREPGVRFVALRDNDGADCSSLKARIVKDCASAGRTDTIVRLACQELEAWYLGDPAALSVAFEDATLADIGRKQRFKDPDSVPQPSRQIGVLAPSFQKVSGARAMAELLDDQRNTSASFRVFVDAVRRLAAELV